MEGSSPPRQPMRILLANDLYSRSSAGGVAVRMAEGLAARGHDVHLLATTQRPDEAVDEDRDGLRLQIAHTPAYPLRWKSWRSLDNPPAVAVLREAVGRFEPDVVHIHNLHIHLSYASLGAARAAGARTVLHVHDVMPFCHQKLFCHLDDRYTPGDPIHYQAGPVKCAFCVRARFNPLRNGRIREVLHEDVDALVAVSHEMGRALVDNGLPAARTVFNGVDPDEGVADAASARRFRERHGLLGRAVVFYGGRLDRLKGGLELVRALARVRRDVPRATLVTVGDALPGFEAEMRALAGRLGLPDDAIIGTGWQSGADLAAAYAAADVVVTPSLCFESFGLVNLEAMRAGKPVVASPWGGPADVVDDGVTGYLVNPLQIGVLAERIGRLLRDRALAARMGAAGRQRVQRLFGLEAQLDAVENLYSELVS